MAVTVRESGRSAVDTEPIEFIRLENQRFGQQQPRQKRC
jgi:hypothetical protein